MRNLSLCFVWRFSFFCFFSWLRVKIGFDKKRLKKTNRIYFCRPFFRWKTKFSYCLWVWLRILGNAQFVRFNTQSDVNEMFHLLSRHDILVECVQCTWYVPIIRWKKKMKQEKGRLHSFNQKSSFSRTKYVSRCEHICKYFGLFTQIAQFEYEEYPT